MCDNLYKNRARIPMFGRIRSLFNCFWKYDQNPKVLKNKIKKPMCTKIGPEFQCFEE